MPNQESAVMDSTVTGKATATARRIPKKKSKVDASAIRAQIQAARAEMKPLKDDIRVAKNELKDTMRTGKATVLAATKQLKLVTGQHVKDVKAHEKGVAGADKALYKQQVVIDKLTAKLG